jgi:nucleotide-binding universal stress UspA family protein
MNTSARYRDLNIILAFDGSEHCLAAIDLLREMPLGAHSTITTIGVLIPRESSNHAVMEAGLEKAGQMLRQSDFNSKTELILGNPAEKIIEYADQIHPDLIVAGAKGLRHTLGILLGGVVQQIVEYSQQPVLVVRAPSKGIKRLLLVTDGSISSQNAVDYLAGSKRGDATSSCERFPLPPSTQVWVMHVLPPLPSPEMIARSWPIGPEILPPLPVDEEQEAAWIKEEEARGAGLLADTVDYLKKCALIEAIPVIKRGDAATEIIQYARDHNIDLIMAGSRGLSQMRSWLLGSVSRKLVHYAHCSVLIVKARHETE